MTILRGRWDDAASSSGMTRGSSGGTTKDPRTRVKVGEVHPLDRIRALPPARADALLAVLLLAEGLFELVVFSPLTGSRFALVGFIILAQAVAIALRRRWPVVTLLVL